jgi:bifunctional DNA-binding transcriptional regulator/antitoxin component of YhaV-PrlF toxin-antitoxin module
MMTIMKTAKITTGGQISIPSAVRRRWATSRVAIEDYGDHLVVRPLPEDVLTALRGSLKGQIRVPTEELRRRARADEETAERRKWRY